MKSVNYTASKLSRSSRSIVKVGALAAFGLTALAAAPRSEAQFFGLVAAGPANFAVVNLGGNFQFNADNNSQFITVTGLKGNVGLMSGSSLSISGYPKTTASGELDLGPGLSYTNNTGAGFAGGVVTNVSGLSAGGAVQTNATATATALAALAADQTYASISSFTTLNATHSGQNVIKITGDISNTLDLNPGAFSNVTFVIDVGGKIQLAGGQGLVNLGGLSSLSTIYNVTGGVTISGGGTAITSQGIILAPNSAIAWDAAPLDGELIGKSVALVSGGRVNNPFVTQASVPEPGAVAMFVGTGVIGMMGLTMRKRSNK
ncbi:MAG: hypothetical protein ABJA67_08535 [Chthonomonadales bacterium]